MRVPRIRLSGPEGSNLVTLTQVVNRGEAEVIMSMLRAYGIFAHAPLYNGRSRAIPINIPRSDLETARALLAEPPAGNGPAAG